jgi:uncharacterized protein YjbI with pentapeptide repeats
VDQEHHPSELTAGGQPETAEDRLLKRVGIDPDKWTVGDRRLALLGVGIGLAVVILAVCGYVFDWQWTGLAKRTFWDWLSLLIVPIVLALGGYLFTRSENRRTQDVAERQRRADRDIADRRAKTDREIAERRAHDEALQKYLDYIGELLLDKNLSLRDSKEGDEVRTLARARTFTALKRLDANHNSSIFDFLRDSQLLGEGTKNIISFSAANLGEVDLAGANLEGVDLEGAFLADANLQSTFFRYAHLVRANLEGANLEGAFLSGANLESAQLIDANLGGANLVNANLGGAVLHRANLAGANLITAKLAYTNLIDANLAGAKLGGANLGSAALWHVDLSGADLSGANLNGANLDGANLSGAAVTEEQLATCDYLKGATMPNGQKYEDLLKDKESRGEYLTDRQKAYLDSLKDEEGRGENRENSAPS